MARPKKLAVPEDIAQTEETENPGYSYEDIADKTTREIAAEPIEEKPDKKDEETTPPIVKDEETKPSIEVENERKQIAEDAVHKVLEEQEKAREEAEKAKIEEKTPNQEYQEIAAKFEQEKGRAPTWDELAEKIEDRAVAKLEQRQEARIKQAQELQAQETRTREEEERRVNSYVDDELQDLYNSGKLTKIQDPNNPSDQGVMERKALFSTWQQVNTQRKAEGKPEILSATRIHEFYYKKPNAQPPGANAPILGGRSAGNAGNDEPEYSYADLKKPWSLLRRNQ